MQVLTLTVNSYQVSQVGFAVSHKLFVTYSIHPFITGIKQWITWVFLYIVPGNKSPNNRVPLL